MVEEMLEAITGMKKLKWQIELLEAICPDAVRAALEWMEVTSVEELFAGRIPTFVLFLEHLCGEIHMVSDTVVQAIAQDVQTLIGVIGRDVHTSADFHQLAKAWRAGEDADGIELYSMAEVQKLASSLKTSEVVARKLVKNGPWRRSGFGSEVIDQLEALKGRTPNFAEVIDAVIDAVTLCKKFQRPVRVTPILVVGEPGIGKSHFTTELAKCLGVPKTRISVDNLQIGADLAGQTHAYVNSSPGELFRILADESHISPIVILDELDKAPKNWGHGDPLGPLHNLLEPGSARVFRDANFPVEINASHVIWIATANTLERIPKTILSRFEAYKIAAPDPELFDGILREICQEFVNEYSGLVIDSDGVAKVLAGMTPREQRQLLQRAVARAIRVGDESVTDSHVMAVMGHQAVRQMPVLEPTGYL